MRIAELRLYRLRLPLVVPYRIAITDIHAFDTVLVEALDEDGASGLGEATLLTGYTEETIDGAWTAAQQLAADLHGLQTGDAIERLAPHATRHPFTTTALVTALEMLAGHPLLAPGRDLAVPLLALAAGKDEPTLAAELERGLAAGYRTFKIKVGFDVTADLARVDLIRRLLAGRADMRLDANQGYSREQALAFVRGLDPDGIELVEQTCAAGDWESAVAVAHAASAPLMLDESIYGAADIERAAELACAQYIKLKLMKAGGLDRLTAQLARIAELGMKPVLGNGVASDVGCWMEACVAPGRIAGAGEMNGWLKPAQGIVSTPLQVRGGSMHIPAGYRPTLDRDSVAQHCEDSRTVKAQTSR